MVYIQEFCIYDHKRSSYIIFQLVSHALLPNGYALRIRGAGDDPNNDKNHHDIPYLTNMRFRWDGLPCIDFRERVLNTLENGLGSMLTNGGTLLQTVRRQDPGGVLGNPPRAAAPQDVVNGSDARNVKAFSCILNYMHTNSNMYKYFMREQNGDGIAIYTIICAYGPIPLPPRMRTAREDAWTRMSMEALRLPLSVKGFLTWVEIVLDQGRQLNKGGVDQKDKFIAGLPKRFDHIRTAMRGDIRFVYPALYNGLAGHLLARNAANPHPLAGQTNIMALARAYIPHWVEKTAEEGLTPKGYNARAVEEINVLVGCTAEEFIHLLTTDVTKSTKCYVCGGEGHAATQETPDGEKIICPTKLLQTGSNTTSFNKALKYKHQSKQLAHSIDELTSQLESAHKLHDTSQRNMRRRSPLPTSHGKAHFISEDEDEDDSGIDTSTAQSCNDDDDDSDNSQDSAFSTVKDFADVAGSSSKSAKKPFRKSFRSKK